MAHFGIPEDLHFKAKWVTPPHVILPISEDPELSAKVNATGLSPRKVQPSAASLRVGAGQPTIADARSRSACALILLTTWTIVAGAAIGGTLLPMLKADAWSLSSVHVVGLAVCMGLVLVCTAGVFAWYWRMLHWNPVHLTMPQNV